MKTLAFLRPAFLWCALLGAILAYAAAASAESPIHSFLGPTSDGAVPYGGLVRGKQGVLYGTAYAGGGYGSGIVFELSPPTVSGGTWTETVLYSFMGGTDGAGPLGALVLDEDGNLYGTTEFGGTAAFNDGVAFELSPPTVSGGAWSESILHAFTGDHGHVIDGAKPYGGLVFGFEGSLYGTTYGGGHAGVGTVFRLTKSKTDMWSEGVIHSFDNSDDGAYPLDTLIVDEAKNLYGTTAFGGRETCGAGCGTVFELSPPATRGEPWTETVLYEFTGIDGDGGNPYAALVFDGAGNLYGTTTAGGESGNGTVFELSPSEEGWTENLLYTFKGESDGAVPYAGVVFDSAGNLYGTAYYGGSYVPKACSETGCGTVFKLTAPSTSGGAWTETTLHEFKTGWEEHDDGYTPYGPLIFGKYGALYGTTTQGGASNNDGTLFSIQP